MLDIKIPRFMREYANYQIKELKQSPLYEDDKRIVDEWIAFIYHALDAYKSGVVSVAEVMHIIGHGKVIQGERKN